MARERKKKLHRDETCAWRVNAIVSKCSPSGSKAAVHSWPVSTHLHPSRQRRGQQVHTEAPRRRLRIGSPLRARGVKNPLRIRPALVAARERETLHFRQRRRRRPSDSQPQQRRIEVSCDGLGGRVRTQQTQDRVDFIMPSFHVIAVYVIEDELDIGPVLLLL